MTPGDGKRTREDTSLDSLIDQMSQDEAIHRRKIPYQVFKPILGCPTSTLLHRQLFGSCSHLSSYGLGLMRTRSLALSQQLIIRSRDNRRVRAPLRVGSVNVLAFDKLGAFLASGASDGGLCLINFDRSMKKMSREDKLQTQAPSARIETSFNIQSVLWNPLDQSQLICTALSRPAIHLYSIEACRSPPIVLDSSSMNRTGHLAAAFSPVSPGVVFAGATTGHIRGWDTRRETSKTMWEVSPLHGRVESLTASRNGHHVYSGHSYGRVSLYDLRKMSMGLFGNKPSPSMVHSWRFAPKSKNTNAIALMPHPSCNAEIVYQLDSGGIGVFDPARSAHLYYGQFNHEKKPEVSIFRQFEVQNEDEQRADLKSLRNCCAVFVTDNELTACVSYSDFVYFANISDRLLSGNISMNRIRTFETVHALDVHPLNNAVVYAQSSNIRVIF